jgi:hypothetical protein
MAEPNDNSVRVGALTWVYIAPVGTTLPTDLAALSATYLNIGYTDMDALTEGLAVTTEILRASQRPAGVRTLVTEVNWSWKFKAMETTKKTLEMYYMGATSTTTSGVTKTSIPGSPVVKRYVMVLEEYDGDVHTRFVIPAVSIGERGEVNHRGTEGIAYDMTANVMATSLTDLGYRYSDDPDLAASPAS